MTGSLLITFDGHYPQYNQRGFEVIVNGEIRYIHYYSSNNLYTTYLNVGDVVTINNFNTQFSESFDVTRKDYTTDDEGGDRGIKETFITGVTGTNQTVTFTASTRADAYDFYYVIDTTINDCLTIGTGFINTIYAPTTFAAVRELKYSNNKIYVGGIFSQYSGSSQSYNVILNEDGTINSGFTANLFTGAGANQYVSTIEILSDGKFLYGGNFTYYSGVSKNRIVKLNSDYTIDTGFTMGTGFNSIVHDIEIQSDNKIIVAGAFTTYSGSTAQRICRLNSNGSLDNTFTSSITGGTIYDVSIYNDGKILVGGFILNNSVPNIVNRLNIDGTIDNTFNQPTFDLGFVFKTKILSDNKILIGGQLYSGSTSYGILRLNSDGSIDQTFNRIDNIVSTDFEITSENKIILIVAGSTPRYITQLNYDGSVDTSFDNINLFPIIGQGLIQGESIVIKPNTDIVIGGSFTGTSIGNYSCLIQVDKYGNSRMC